MELANEILTVKIHLKNQALIEFYRLFVAAGNWICFRQQNGLTAKKLLHLFFKIFSVALNSPEIRFFTEFVTFLFCFVFSSIVLLDAFFLFTE